MHGNLGLLSVLPSPSTWSQHQINKYRGKRRGNRKTSQPPTHAYKIIWALLCHEETGSPIELVGGTDSSFQHRLLD